MSDRSEEMLRLQALVLESIATGDSMDRTLAQLCGLVEGMVPSSICSTMLLDGQSGALNVASAPRGTPELIDALNGLVPSDLAGSCGTAVHQGQPVYVQDTSTDPRWAGLRDVATEFGIQACWSVPIVAKSGVVLGSFAISHTKRCGPSDFHKQILKTASHLAGIAIERGRAEGMLLASERKYHDLYDNAPDMFATLEASTGRIVECNRTLLSMLGYGRDEIVGRQVLDIYDSSCRSVAAAILRSFLESGETQAECLQLRHKDGRAIDVSLKVSAERDDEGNVRYGRSVWRDVTDRRRAEDAIQQAQKLESLGVLAGGIAHDFNNLLVGIMGNASLAMAELPPEAPARKRIATIDSASRRAAELTSQLLAYAGKGKLRTEPLDLSLLVSEMAELLRTSVSRRIALRYDVNEGATWIEADATQIRQVVMNLITNAADSHRDGPGTVSVRCGSTSANPGDLAEYTIGRELSEGTYVYLEVEDEGKGMDSATQERIFDPFFTTKATGQGLGLAATLGIVKGHHGALRVESASGAGTRFRLLFPTIARPPAAREIREREEPSVRAGTVLVVDDEKIVADVAAGMLSRTGFHVLTALGGREAIRIAREREGALDAVLLDLSMPDMDGEQTFDELRSLYADLPVLFCSGHGTQDVVNRAAGRRRTAFLAKPFVPADLLSNLDQLLASKEQSASSAG